MGFVRGAGLSYIGVELVTLVLDIIHEGSNFSFFHSFTLATMAFLFLLVYVICFSTEFLIQWGEFKYYEKPVALIISLGMGVLIASIFSFFFIQILIGSFLFYLGRNTFKSKEVTILTTAFPIIFLIFGLTGPSLFS
jgi:hypothetical protein